MVTKAQARPVGLRLDASEAASFESVALAEMPVMYRVAKRLTLDPVEAEDLVAQALLLAARAWPTFDQRHTRSWLLKILKNEFYKRRVERKAHLSLNDHDPAEHSVEKRVGDRLTAQAIIDTMDRLPEEYRMAVVLCDGEEMSYEEAARVLDVPMGTLRSRLFRGRKMLQQRLQGWIEQ